MIFNIRRVSKDRNQQRRLRPLGLTERRKPRTCGVHEAKRRNTIKEEGVIDQAS